MMIRDFHYTTCANSDKERENSTFFRKLKKKNYFSQNMHCQNFCQKDKMYFLSRHNIMCFWVSHKDSFLDKEKFSTDI